MGLSHRELVAILLSKLRQLLVEYEHNVHPNAEVGRMEEALLFVEAAFFDFFEMVLPSRSANNNRNMQVKTAVDVAYYLVGLTEIDGDISLFQLLNAFFPFFGIVNGDDDFMLVGKGGFLHLVPHLSVSYDGDFHD
jgi:hypothetical protein